MFAKLLKYDFRSTWGLLGLLSVIALGAGALGSVVARLLEREPEGFFLTMLIISMITVVFYLVGYCIAAMFLLLGRFYKSRFTDEGYMTFTLPVSNHQILLSSFLNCTLGLIVCMIVTVAAFFIMVFFGVADLDGQRWEAVKVFFDVLPKFLKDVGVGNILMFLLMLLAGLTSEVFTIMLSITLGAIIAKKHKILMAVAAYYGINIAVSVASVSFMASSGLLQMREMVQSTFMGFGGCATAGYCLLSLICYFIMYYLTSRKLNLN